MAQRPINPRRRPSRAAAQFRDILPPGEVARLDQIAAERRRAVEEAKAAAEADSAYFTQLIASGIPKTHAIQGWRLWMGERYTPDFYEMDDEEAAE